MYTEFVLYISNVHSDQTRRTDICIYLDAFHLQIIVALFRLSICILRFVFVFLLGRNGQLFLKFLRRFLFALKPSTAPKRCFRWCLFFHLNKGSADIIFFFGEFSKERIICSRSCWLHLFNQTILTLVVPLVLTQN